LKVLRYGPIGVVMVVFDTISSFMQEEIGVYFTKIFLKILESDNSTTLHKGMVLQALLQICNNAQTLLDIFVNYDCSLGSSDVFGRYQITPLSLLPSPPTTKLKRNF